MGRRTLFIINPAAGGGRGAKRWEQVERSLSAAGRPPEKVFTTQPGEAEWVACGATGYDLLVAVGGDGTVSEVANGILRAPTQTALAVVPVGTGNDIARALRLHTPTDSIQALLDGELRPTDVIRIDYSKGSESVRRFALLFAGVGIIGPVLRHTGKWLKRLLGQSLAYRAGLVRALYHYRSPEMRLDANGKTFQGRFIFVGLNNAEDAGGGMRIAPGARLDDGLLNVNLVGEIGRWEVLMELRRLAQGKHTGHPKVSYFSAQQVHIETEAPVEVAADGDLIGHTPAQFQIQPKMLSVLGR